MRDAGTTPEWTLMVGDRPEDEAAAKAAGCGFVWAAEFFAPYEQAGGQA
jgi:phosphoglycolate phosphatase-like HAD superfamily hydrolase